MSTAPFALCWEIFARHRLLYTLTAIYLGLACLVVALLPARMRSPDLGLLLAAPLLASFLVLIGSLAYGFEADLRATTTGFPRRLLTLPVSSWTLATTPFVLGTVSIFTLWLIVAHGLFLPCHFTFSLFLPPLALAALVAWLQALSWFPFPLPWLRIAGFTIIGICLIGGILSLKENWLGLEMLTGWYLALLALAYPVALTGVCLGRRGAWVSEPFQVDRVHVEAPTVPPPFTSHLRAQLWLEWRNTGWLLLTTIMLWFLFTLPLVHLTERTLRQKALFFPHLVGPVETFGSAWIAVGLAFPLPLFFCLLSGHELGTMGRRRGLHSTFYTTRAVSTMTVIVGKFTLAFLINLAVWMGITVTLLSWALVSGHYSDMIHRLTRFSHAGYTGPQLLILLVLFGIVVSWLLLIAGLWPRLTGRTWWVATTLSGWVLSGVLVVILLPRWRPEWHPWLVGAISTGLLLKLASTIWVARQLLHQNFLTLPTLGLVLLIWACFAACLAWFVHLLTSGNIVTIAGTVLLLPLTSWLLAPVALAWGRHR